MLFTGYSEHSIDSKLRLAIPAKYRNQWDSVRDGNAWFCIPWPSGLLRLYTESQFNRLAEAMGAANAMRRTAGWCLSLKSEAGRSSVCKKSPLWRG